MPDNLYHATLKTHKRGASIVVPDGMLTEYWERLAAADQLEAEVRLEEGRPEGAQSRRNTQYAFGDLYDCQNYAQRQYKGDLHYYRVSMDNPTVVPMVLVNIIGSTNGTPKQIAALVSEYWQPTLGWEVLEYLAASMTIIEEVKPDDRKLLEVAHFSYTSDHIQATEFRKRVLATVK